MESSTEKDIMSLADNMAAAACSFNSQNYEIFIECRDRLKSTLSALFSRSDTLK